MKNLRNLRFLLSTFGAALMVLAWSSPSQASLFTGTNGSNLSASVDFTASGTDLIVTLTNTSSTAVVNGTGVLTSVFFNLPGNPTLTRVSALLNGSTVANGPDGGGVVGGEWAYKTGLAAPHSATQGISSSGLGLFGPGDRFPGANLQGPDSPDGTQYGIANLGYVAGTGNSSINSSGMIRDHVVFTLSGLATGFNTNLISNVSFQYGTDLREPNIPGHPPSVVPEPSTMAIAALGALGFLGFGLRRRLKK